MAIRSLTEDEQALALGLLQLGHTQVEVANRLGCCDRTIKRLVSYTRKYLEDCIVQPEPVPVDLLEAVTEDQWLLRTHLRQKVLSGTASGYEVEAYRKVLADLANRAVVVLDVGTILGDSDEVEHQAAKEA